MTWGAVPESQKGRKVASTFFFCSFLRGEGNRRCFFFYLLYIYIFIIRIIKSKTSKKVLHTGSDVSGVYKPIQQAK